ncbi:MAG: class I SAM-dependent methyltransferase, partial [Ardenticatenaceae bacterium]
MRIPKPACLGPHNASAFEELSVARAYRYRPPYPAEVFTFLTYLIVDEPRRLLDIGCGTGALARRLVPLVDQVDAVDVSATMIEEGKQLLHGNHPHLTWIVGRVEEVTPAPPYALVTAGDSLHWMEWERVLPRLATLLTLNGHLAIVSNGRLDTAWDEELMRLIRRYSTIQDYRAIDLTAELEQRGLFKVHGTHETTPSSF